MQSVAHLEACGQESMARELQWLVEQSIPETMGHVRQSLAAISFLESQPGRHTARASSQVSIAAEGAGVSGTATVSGTAVTQLSLTVPEHGQTAHEAAKTTVYLKKGETLPLRQALDARCYARAALDRLEELQQFDSCGDALVYIEGVLGSIQDARRMLAAESRLGAAPLHTGSSEKFAPPLPQNTAVECGLDGCALVVRVYWVRPRQGIQSTGLLDAFTREQSTGQTVVHDGRLAEVAREAVLQAPLEELQRDLARLDRAAGDCIDAIGQLHA
ncbi:hypothetical protein LPJ61_006608, partial [Coemansia biformis]